MFNYLYTLLCGKNINPDYKVHIYPFIGLFTLLFAAGLSFIFYVVLGRLRPIWYKTTHWLVIMVLILLVASSLAFNYAEQMTGGDTPFTYTFAMVNALYAFIYYVIFSLIFKRFSIYAKRTPF
jgi:drug/metabolite transporter (DMT)-like permease